MERTPGDKFSYEVVEKTSPDKLLYTNGKFEYEPMGWVKIDGQPYPLGYRVTTLDNRSLNLDHHGKILTYELGKWIGIPKESLVADIKGRGGVWSATDIHSAWDLERHCRDRWNMRTKTYLAAVDNPIFATSYRVKSERIMLLEELR